MSDAPRSRRRAPRELAAPALVSQLSAPSILGIDARRYLEIIVPACRPEVIELGKLRLVRLEVALAAIERLSRTRPELAPVDAESEGELARRLGLRRSA